MCDTNPAEVAPMGPWTANAEWSGEVLALEPVDELSVLTVCDNVLDMLLPDQGPARRLSARGGQQVPMLDAPVLEGARRSMPRWPNPADIEVIVCSHGHFDHTTGLSGLIGQLGPANMPVLVHPEFW